MHVHKSKRILLLKVIHPIVRDCIALLLLQQHGLYDVRYEMRSGSFLSWLRSEALLHIGARHWLAGQTADNFHIVLFGDEPKIPLTLRLSSNGLTSPYFAYKSREGREEVRTEFSRDFEQTSSVLLIQCISDYYALLK